MKNVKIINSFPAQGLTIKNGLISAINARFYSNTSFLSENFFSKNILLIKTQALNFYQLRGKLLKRKYSSDNSILNSYESRGPLFKTRIVPKLNTKDNNLGVELDIQSKNSLINPPALDFSDKELFNKENKGEISHLYMPGNPLSILFPNYFRKLYKAGYNSHLHKVLKNDMIVCAMIKVCLESGEFKTLGSQFGYKFNYDELGNWNFSKSCYYKILYDYYSLIWIKKKPSKRLPFLYKFDYKFTEHMAPLNLDQMYTKLIGELFDFIDEYHDPNINYFIISFTEIKSLINHKKPLKNVNNIPLKKNISNVRNFRKVFNSTILPLTMDEGFYGKRNYSTRREYIDEENKLKRIIYDDSSNKVRKEIYSLESGALIESYIDTKQDDNTFIRYHPKSKSSVIIKNNKVIQTSINIKLPAITYKSNKKIENSFNKHIGSFDLETFQNDKGEPEVYAVGFSYGGNNVLISKPSVFTYYLDKNKGIKSNEIVLECIEEMLKTKYKKAIFYTHNLGGFDVLFVLKILGEYNEKIGDEYYKLKAVLRDNKILKLQISVKKSKSVTNTITLVDSLALLPTSLSSLSKGFSTEYIKPFFPYSFVSEKTLNYEGVTPSIEFFSSLNEQMTIDEYKKIYKEDWKLKDQTLKYLESDLISLLQIMYEFSNNIFDNYHVQVSECLTITSLALKIFLKNFYKNQNKKLALIKQKNIYKDLKEAYFGGLSEVYRGYGENLFYYDVNSLYPFVALKDMPGNECDFIESHTDKGLDIINDKLFGYFYCDVKTTVGYYGLLPYRMNGLLTYPVGKFSGWFFSPQIEFALKRGYEITIKKGYSFNRVSDVFKDYVITIYKEKQESTGAKRLIAKFLLNALLGRFGMHIDKRVTSLIRGYDKYTDVITKFEVYDEKKISEDLFLMTHDSQPSETICNQHGVDYIETLNKTKGFSVKSEESTSVRNVSVGVSAAVTAYSSISMLEIKEYILSSGGKIYYTDTDSIVTDIKLPDKYTGTGIGLFKLEHKIIRGYFISSKLYCLVVWDDENNCEKIIVKAKGVHGSKLTEDDFIKMLDNKIISHGVKTSSVKSYSKGYVKLDIKDNIHLNPDSYRKRIKIFDKKTGEWINTRPLVIGGEFSEDLWKD